MFHPRHIFFLSAAVVLTPACASKVLPQQQMMDTQASITSAEELKGDEDPDAKLHLQFARDQLAAAKRMMEEGEDDEALRMLDRASIDADLALLLARTEKLRQESREAQSEVDELQADSKTTKPAEPTTQMTAAE
jgi:hypothetical protein